MIECSNKPIWYVKKRKKFRKKPFIIFLIIFISIAMLLYYNFVIARNIIDICCDFSSVYVNETINESIKDSLNDAVKYTDLVHIEKNSSGEISLMSVNSYKVNQISNDTTIIAQEKIKRKLSEGVHIPLLAFSGIDLLSGLGPNVTLKIISISSVNCDFSSQFKSVGINQTMHSIYVDVKCKLLITLPLNKKEIDFSTPILISEAVLVGAVPQIYLNGDLFNK